MLCASPLLPLSCFVAAASELLRRCCLLLLPSSLLPLTASFVAAASYCFLCRCCLVLRPRSLLPPLVFHRSCLMLRLSSLLTLASPFINAASSNTSFIRAPSCLVLGDADSPLSAWAHLIPASFSNAHSPKQDPYGCEQEA